MASELKPCGGCGATSEKERCIGCLHDFGTPESAWVATRPAPVEGLETVAKVDSRLGDMSRLSIIDRPLSIGTEVCLRSQAESEIRKVRKDAEELLAAERADHDNTIATLSSLIEDNAALIHDLNRLKDHETELVNDNAALTARVKELEEDLKTYRRLG